MQRLGDGLQRLPGHLDHQFTVAIGGHGIAEQCKFVAEDDVGWVCDRIAG